MTSLLAAQGACGESVSVDLTSPRQVIRGFGGMNHKIWTGYDLSTSDRNLAFGTGDGQIGLSILRIWVSDKPSEWSIEVASAKDVVSRGGLVFATPWNPPGGGNNATKTAGTWRELYKTDRWRLMPGKYNDYAKHLNDFVAYMKGQGVPLNSVGIQNEPDWDIDWTGGTATDMYNLAKSVCPQITGSKCMSAESYSFNKAYYDQILNDPAVLNSVGIFGTHFYGTASGSMAFPLFQTKGVPAGKDFWMTEVYTDSKGNADDWPLALDVGTNIHNALVEGQMNAYVWWYIRRDYGPILNSTGKVSKRGWIMAQFARFVRPGSRRVEATKAPASGVLVSAYAGPDGAPVIVAVNQNASAKTLSFSVKGAGSVASYRRWTTSGSKSVASDGIVPATDGSFSASLDPQSVTTFAGSAPVGVGRIPSTTEPSSGRRFRIFDLAGARIGEVLQDGGDGLQAKVAGIARRPGIYLAESMDGHTKLRVAVPGGR